MVLNGKRAVDVVGWLNGAENGRAANGHLANGHHAWDSAVAVLADAGCNGAAAQPPLDLPEAFPEQPRSGAPFLSRRSSSAVSEAASLGRHSNGGAAEPLCAPGSTLKQQQQRQPGRPASLHTRSGSQHSQPGTPCSSVGTPRTTRSVGRSKLGLPNGCAAEQPACCAAEAQPCGRGCSEGDEAVEGVSHRRALKRAGGQRAGAGAERLAEMLEACSWLGLHLLLTSAVGRQSCGGTRCVGCRVLPLYLTLGPFARVCSSQFSQLLLCSCSDVLGGIGWLVVSPQDGC